jgi:DNA end-binding protein Ku
MRSTWKGSIGFGMVNIPIKLYAATDDKADTIALCNIHRVCGTALKAPKWCPKCEKIIEIEEIGKAYPEDRKKEHCIPIDEAELAALPLASAHAIQIEGFMPAVPDRRFPEKFYFAEPDAGGDRAFALLEAALKAQVLVAIGKIGLTSREHLVAIMPTGDGLLYVATLHWAIELKSDDELHRPQAKVSDKELQMAKMLIATLPQTIDLAQFDNEYGNALKRLIEAKKQGITIAAPVASVSKEVDLVDQLMASLKAAESTKA